MDIWETDKLILFIAFVMPGFISIKIYDLLSYGNKVKSAESIIDAITYSSLNYALFAMPIWLVETNNLNIYFPFLYVLFYFIVLFISPILIAWMWQKLRKSNFFQTQMTHPIAKPWDYVFSQRKSYWVKITLKNGKLIGGKYAENSFSSSYPEEEQLYLEETWIMKDNGGFDRPKKRTSGILISSNEILYIEFIQYREEKNE